MKRGSVILILGDVETGSGHVLKTWADSLNTRALDEYDLRAHCVVNYYCMCDK